MKGDIFIPGLDLDLEEVAGDVVVEKGILEGTHLDPPDSETLFGKDGNNEHGHGR